jgi:hypothetical protein
MAHLGTRTPWHLWVVGVISLIWNGFGANDYLQTQLRNTQYLEQMGYPSEGMAYLDSFPVWAEAGWALGVWGAALGSLLLLLRSRFAVWSFAVSIIGIALTTIYEAGADMPPELAAIQPAWFPFVLWGIALALLGYAIAMRRRGVLR